MVLLLAGTELSVVIWVATYIGMHPTKTYLYYPALAVLWVIYGAIAYVLVKQIKKDKK